MWLGTVALSADRLEPAEQALRQALELADQLVAAGPADEELCMTVGIGYQYLAETLLRVSKGEEAESAARQSLRGLSRVWRPTSQTTPRSEENSCRRANSWPGSSSITAKPTRGGGRVNVWSKSWKVPWPKNLTLK